MDLGTFRGITTLLIMIAFIGVVIWVFRPGSTKTYEDPSGIPFRHEDKPAKRGEADAKEA